MRGTGENDESTADRKRATGNKHEQHDNSETGEHRKGKRKVMKGDVYFE